MSKIKKVIDQKNFPRKLPLHMTLTLWLTLKVFNAPEWVWGAVGGLMAIIWIFCLYELGTVDEEKVDIFNDDKKPSA